MNMQGSFKYLPHTADIHQSMHDLAAQLSACVFMQPVRIVLPEGQHLDISLEADAAASADGPTRLVGTAFLKALPEVEQVAAQVYHCCLELHAGQVCDVLPRRKRLGPISLWGS